MMIKKLIMVTYILCFAFSGFAAITVTAPSSAETLKAAEDYAAAAFQDPWDMNEQSDPGWFIFKVVPGSHSNLTNISFANGIFSASSTNTDPNISVLDTGFGQASLTCDLGKIGTNYKINADKYKIFAIRMKLNKNHDAQLFWSRKTIYDDYSYSGIFHTYSGWRIYIINIPSLGYTKVPGYSKGYGWNNEIGSLRFDPASAKVNIDIDWIRLVENKSSLYRTVRWTGNSGNVDIYLDNDKNEGNGTLGVVAKSVSGTSYSLYAGALAPGVKYYVGVKNSSGGSLRYSAGYYRVNDIPTVVFTAPSEEGGEDFATARLNNAWDMNATSDLDGYAYLSGAPTITTISAENLSGDSLGNIRVLKGTSAPVAGNVGEAILYPLWFNGGRGASNMIDSSKYRILVLKMGLPGNWDPVAGSEARVFWHVQGEFNSSGIELMHQSADIILRHKSGKIVMNTIIADMKNLALEQSQSNTGWNGWIDGFRVDPHEYATAKAFYIREIKLAAFERADSSYTFKWDYTDSITQGSSLSLYYDTNASGFNGTLIKSGINPSAEQYTWNTSKKAAGTYYIYATVSDGRNTNRSYARWPIVIDHSAEPTASIQLSRDSMAFGGVGGTSTPPQTFLIENTGTGTMNWNVSTSAGWLIATPPSGSGSGVVTVSVNGSTLARGTYNGTVTVSSANAVNTPQPLAVTLKMYRAGTTGKPFGNFATPAHGSHVSSSIAVTGWALDDVGVQSVKIYYGGTYVGDAVFIEGARPDIETANPGYPLNYRAGWGYNLLSNFFPNGGNGTYTLYAKATDREGHEVTLGAKTIYVDNKSAVKPFGAIDTPGQGAAVSGGNYTNIGWALTPDPNKIPTNGSTIHVYVDGVKLGTVDYNKYRSDIASLFPDYKNSSGGGATFNFDTTAYDNGIHSIHWIATDNAGNTDGIGSRFFTIQNTGGNQMDSATGSRLAVDSKKLPRIPLEYSEPVSIKKGYNKNTPAKILHPDDKGIITVETGELQRLEIQLDEQVGSGNRFSGYLVVGDRLAPLPAGSTLDRQRGIFYWLPGPGFVGNYRLVFIDDNRDIRKRVDINILAKYPAK